MPFDPSKLSTLVIKIGTSLLSGQRAFEGLVMEAVVQEICALKSSNDINIVIVTSGAVGCGMRTLGLDERPKSLREKQAVAAVGQATLMHYYETLFRTYGEGLSSAQVLLTLADLDNRVTYLNVRNTLETLFEMRRVIPVVNENDSTATEELRFGDNDTLAARIAAKLSAELLIILSDVDGLYDKNPNAHADAKLLEFVPEITPEILACAGGPGSEAATGGMRTKLEAAKIATAAGVNVAIANGHCDRIIGSVLEGTAHCTIFSREAEALSHRKRWIAFGRALRGRLRVDQGAEDAMVQRGSSLLAAGVTAVSGAFVPGDAVEICGPAGRAFARALVNYSSQEIQQVLGRKSSELESILGRKDLQEIVHRDNMALLQ